MSPVEPEPTVASSVDIIDSTTQRAQVLIAKFLLAGLEVFVIMGFLALHWLLEKVEELTLPAGWVAIAKIVQGTLACAILIISVHLVFDMLVLFLPGLRQFSVVKTLADGGLDDDDDDK